MNSTEIKSAILADYTRYKAKHQGVMEAINDHEHGSINEIYFSFYRISGGFWHAGHSENLFHPIFSLHLDTFGHFMAFWSDFFDL